MYVLVVESGRRMVKENIEHTFRSYKTHALVDFGLLRNDPLDVLFYASFQGLHNALCHPFYS